MQWSSGGDSELRSGRSGKMSENENTAALERRIAAHNDWLSSGGERGDMIMQAIGWLAREDKLSIEEGTRGRIVSLV